MERFESPAQNVTLFVVHAVALADGRSPLLAVGRVQAGRDLLSGAVIPRPSSEQGFRNSPLFVSVGVGRGGFLD